MIRKRNPQLGVIGVGLTPQDNAGAANAGAANAGAANAASDPNATTGTAATNTAKTTDANTATAKTGTATATGTNTSTGTATATGTATVTDKTATDTTVSHHGRSVFSYGLIALYRRLGLQLVPQLALVLTLLPVVPRPLVPAAPPAAARPHPRPALHHPRPLHRRVPQSPHKNSNSLRPRTMTPSRQSLLLITRRLSSRSRSRALWAALTLKTLPPRRLKAVGHSPRPAKSA
jgi:hypothetical protein